MSSPTPNADTAATPPFGVSVRGSLPAFFASFFLLVWSYGFLVFNFSISVDEELHLSGLPGLNVEWLRSGRWAIYLFKVTLGSLDVVPFFTGLFALLFLAAAAAALHFGFRSTQPAGQASFGDWALTSLIFPTTPVFVFTLCFATFDAEIGFGVFLAILSAVLASGVIHQGQPIRTAVIAAVLLGVAMGVYQPMLIMWLAALLSFELSALLLRDNGWDASPPGLKKFVTHLIAICAGGVLIYKIVDWSVIFFAGKSAYLEGYLNWPREHFRTAAFRLFQSSKGFVSGDLFQAGIGWKILLGVEIAAAVIVLLKARQRRLFWITGAILFALFILPFSLSLVTGFPLPLRTMFPIAVSFTAPVVIAWSMLRNRSLRLILFGAVVLVSLSNVQWINRVLLADFRRYQNDVFLAQQIGREVERLSSLHGPRPVRIAVIGTHQANPDIFGYKYEVLGSSLFEWDGGNPFRVQAFLRALGFGSFSVPSGDDIRQAIKESPAMESWPAASSIRIEDDLAIVKLSAPTPQQVRNYLK